MARRRHGHTPRFPLALVQQLATTGRYRLTDTARAGAESLYLDEDEVVECVCGLTSDDYEQTLASTAIPGTFQDVYKPRFHGYEIYLKLRLVEDRMVIVISFKHNTSP